jgi:choline dehydrogenase-like flavoprotein
MYVQQRQEYDAIVVGSGIAGGWAAKELCEKGLKVLVLERGRMIEHGKYPTEWKQPWDFAQRGLGNKYVYETEYPVQSRDGSFGEATAQWFVSDKDQPYLTPGGMPFRWIRGYHLGGRSLKWGRQCYRWSNLDFEANKRDGQAWTGRSATTTSRPGTATSNASSASVVRRSGCPTCPMASSSPRWS